MTVLQLLRCVRTLGAVLALAGFAVAAPLAASASTVQATGAVCGTKTISHVAAPGVGKTATFTLPTAGSVTLVQLSTTTLKVTATAPASGWKATVLTASGTTVHVGFQVVKLDNEQERFWARTNTKGTTITTIVQTCT
jgi:hypothetical protein